MQPAASHWQCITQKQLQPAAPTAPHIWSIQYPYCRELTGQQTQGRWQHAMQHADTRRFVSDEHSATTGMILHFLIAGVCRVPWHTPNFPCLGTTSAGWLCLPQARPESKHHQHDGAMCKSALQQRSQGCAARLVRETTSLVNLTHSVAKQSWQMIIAPLAEGHTESTLCWGTH